MLKTGAGLLLAAHLLVLLSPRLFAAAEAHALINLVLLSVAGALRAGGARRLWLALCIFGLAALNATLQAGASLHDRLDPNLDREAVAVEGVVASLLTVRDQSISFVLEEARIADGPAVPLPARIKVSWFMSARHPAPGERWRLQLRMRSPRGRLNPGGFDQEAWLFRERIGATASVIASETNERLQFTSGQQILQLRAAVAERIDQALGAHPARGIITGLAVGARQEISRSQWRALADTGTGHLVAISGLHVGLVAGFVFLIARFAWGCVPPLAARIAPLDAAWVPALTAAFFYALLAGFAMPTRRALLMLSLWFMARALRRPLRPAALLSLTLAGCLAMDALCVLSPGFWLSFGAVTTLVLAAPRVVAAGRMRLIPLQGLVFVGLAPVTFAAFGKLSLLSPVANLFMIPYFSFLVIPLILVYLALAPMAPDLASHLLSVAAWLITSIWPLLDWLAAAELLRWQGSALSISLLMSLVLLAILGLAPGWPGRSTLLSALVLAVLFARPASVPRGSLELTILDVGHGLAMIVRTRKHTLIYDSGPGGSGEELTSALAALGGASPDIMILSHDDANHLSGAPAVVQRFPAIAVMTGAPEAVSSHLGTYWTRPCQPGLAWRWDGVSFEILQPGREILWEDDDSSCVLAVSVADTRILITGDLTQRGERRLLKRYPDLQADVVIGLNHGSRSASTQELVRTLGATTVVFSTAWVNPWGLPASEVIRRWQAQGASVVATGDAGAVSVRVSGQGRDWQVTELRRQHPRPWRPPPLR